MENRNNRPPSGDFDINFLGGSSRKRKSAAMDQPGAVSESNLLYYTPWESNLQKANFLSGAQVEESHVLYLNQPKSIEPTSLRHQFEKDRFHTQSYYPGSWLNCKGSFHGNRTENISNASSHVPPQHSLNMQAGPSAGVSNWQPQAQNMSGPSEAYTFLPFLEADDAHTRRAQVASCFEELEGFGIKNHPIDKMPLGVFSTPSKSMSMEILQHCFLKPKGHSDDNDGITFSQEDNRSGVSYEMRQGNFSKDGGIMDVPSVGAAAAVAASLGSSLGTEQSQNPIVWQNEVKFGSGGTLGVSSGKISENGEQGQGDNFVKTKETEKASDTKSLLHFLPDSLPKNSSPTSTVESGQKKDQTHGSPGSDEKSKSQFGKPASLVAEKLWDGSVQLSTSVVVSAVAFFKSGEKLLDTNWCESVEVKGKVRLEAFEKYIQDLPRSRNRGLMVISLCWKEGSSETGLTGMKEVAKAYKKGQRVGFAHLSPGIDIYICPRSDAIITILAKYGFFKGMAAVEDKPDSMIGCVVWRKNRTSSNSVVKKPESKSNSSSEQPLNSPSLSPMQQAAEKEKDLAVTQQPQASIAPASVTVSSTIKGGETNGSKSKNVNSSKNQIEINGYISGPEQPKIGLELQEPVMQPFMPFPSDKRKVENMFCSDDDDLPEFDFRTACGTSQTSITKPSVPLLSDQRFPPEGVRNTDRLVLPGTPDVPVMSVSSQKSDHSTLPRLPLTAKEGIPPLMKICDREPQIPVFSNMGERSSLQNKGTTTPVSAPRNLFDDDDDDMPEWCPPELQRKSLAQTTRPSTTFPPELQNPSSQTLGRGPSRPVPLSPSLVATQPPFSSQPFPHTFHFPTPKEPQPRPPKRGPSCSIGSNSDSILGPPPSFDAKLPFYPAEKRGRRHR